MNLAPRYLIDAGAGCFPRSSWMLAPVERTLLTGRAQRYVAHAPILEGFLSGYTHSPVIRTIGLLIGLQIETLIHPPLSIPQAHGQLDRGPVLSIADGQLEALIGAKGVVGLPG